MPYNPVRLQPGIDVEKTPALNQGGWSDSAFIRWMEGLPQKYGGWTKYWNSSVNSPTRALHAWLANTHSLGASEAGDMDCLAIGAESALTVVATQNGVQSAYPIMPLTRTQNFAVASAFTTYTATPPTSPNLNMVKVAATASNLSNYSSANLTVPVSVDGLLLYGQYPVQAIDNNNFYLLISPQAATSATTGGTVPVFTATASSPQVQVTMNNHGLSLPAEFDFQVPTTLPTTGGLPAPVIGGVYPVNQIVDANNFTILLPQGAAPATGSATMNGGNAQIEYFTVAGPPGVGSGWGSGGWGVGSWGYGSSPSFTPGTPLTGPGGGSIATWTLDNWGTWLVACPDQGPIFYWVPGSGFTQARLIEAAPQANHGIFVMAPQQILVAYGSTTLGNVHDPLLVRWSDVGNLSSWIASSQNQAGSYRIPEGSEIICGLSVGQQGLLFTDIETWSMSYIGPPYVFGFNKLSTGTGIVESRHAAAQLMGVTYWMGQGNFYALDSGGVHDLPCPVWDKVFQNVNKNYQSKITAAPNSLFNEIGWFYPSLNSTEVDTYVKYSVTENAWDFGPLQRTSWIDQSSLGPPIGGDVNGLVYKHETGFDMDGVAMPASITTGWFMISEGDPVTFVDLLLPDFKFGPYPAPATAQIKLTIFTADWPIGPVHQLGPYTVTAATKWLNVRARGRMMRVMISSNDIGSFWRLGDLRYRGMPDGRRGD